MKKVTVTRVIKVGEQPYFKVQCDDGTLKTFSFSIYNEERDKNAAMVFAKLLENDMKDTEEIIYQTPETN